MSNYTSVPGLFQNSQRAEPERLDRYDWLEYQIQRAERRAQLLRGRILTLRGADAGTRFGVGASLRVVHPACLYVGDEVTIEGPGFLHCLSRYGVHIGHHTSIAPYLWLHCGASPGAMGCGFFRLGNHSFIGPYGSMGAAGGITIGDHVQLGPRVSIVAENHCFEDATRRIDEQGVWHQGVVIEDDCWIGAGAIILDGVTIGTGSVIGAGAVVTRSIPEYSVSAGCPARVIRSRK